MGKTKRINYSKETLEQLQFFADTQGHGNLSAALATVVKFGVPYLLSGQAPVQAVVYAPPLSSLPQPEVKQETGDGIDINRLAHLLEEF